MKTTETESETLKLEERRAKLVFWQKIEQTLEQILREIKPEELDAEVKNENNQTR